jgi:hypothetical protein
MRNISYLISGTVELQAMVASSAVTHAVDGFGVGMLLESYRVNEFVLPSANEPPDASAGA